MICEPYICVEGKPLGKIQWYQEGCPSKQDYDLGYWKPYADFEREKLKQLGAADAIYVKGFVYTVWVRCGDRYDSQDLIGYKDEDYDADSESGRLLKRAEFLKKVCESEQIEWLPKEKCECEHNTGSPICPKVCQNCLIDYPEKNCTCSCHQEEKEANVYKGDMKSVVKKLINSRKEQKPECDGGCVCVCDASAPCNKNHKDCGICKPEEKDYYTKEEEKRFRNDLLKVLNDVVADSNSIKYLCQEYL